MSEHPDNLNKFLSSIISYVISKECKYDNYYEWFNHKSTISSSFYDHWCIGFNCGDIRISRQIEGKDMLHKCGECDLLIMRREKRIEDVFVITPEYLLQQVIEAYNELNTMLDGKVFCKISGHFVSNDFYDIKLQTAQLFGYDGLDECCVCTELTTIKTDCRHPLCLECWGKLKKRTCPMCRQDISCSNVACLHCQDEEDDE